MQAAFICLTISRKRQMGPSLGICKTLIETFKNTPSSLISHPIDYAREQNILIIISLAILITTMIFMPISIYQVRPQDLEIWCCFFFSPFTWGIFFFLLPFFLLTTLLNYIAISYLNSKPQLARNSSAHKFGLSFLCFVGFANNLFTIWLFFHSSCFRFSLQTALFPLWATCKIGFLFFFPLLLCLTPCTFHLWSTSEKRQLIDELLLPVFFRISIQMMAQTLRLSNVQTNHTNSQSCSSSCSSSFKMSSIKIQTDRYQNQARPMSLQTQYSVIKSSFETLTETRSD